VNGPIRIAVMGTGQFGCLHARTLAALPEARLTALGNRTRSRAEALAGELGVADVFGSMDELIERRLADAVVIATSNETHAPLARQAVGAGLHVLIEKPVGVNLAEVQCLDGEARHANSVVMAGHVCLFHSLVAPLVERVRHEGFRSTHFVRHRPAALVRLFPGEHPIAMTMVHDLSVAAQLAEGDEPVDLEAWDAVDASGAADQSWARLRWGDGRVATFHAHWILPPAAGDDGHDWMEVFGGGYHTRVATNPQAWTWAADHLTWPVALEMSAVHGRPTGMLAEELRSFLAACRGAAVPAGCRICDAVQIQGWMERLLASARNHRLRSAGTAAHPSQGAT
jgi:predicted dehydrogenase